MKYRWQKDYEWISKFLLFIVDILSINLAFTLAYFIRFYTPLIPLTSEIPAFSIYLRAMIVVTVVSVVVFKLMNVYESANIDFFNVVKALSLCFLILLSTTFLYRAESYSRLVVVIAFILSILVVFISSKAVNAVNKYLFMRGIGVQRVLIIGDKVFARKIHEKIGDLPQYKIVDFINSKHSSIKDLNELKSIIDNRKIDELVLAFGPNDHEKILQIISACGKKITYKIVPDVLDIITKIDLNTIKGIPLLTVKTPLKGFNLVLKRAFDVVVASLLLIIVSPFLILLAIAIKLDSQGPIIYKQKRVTEGNKFFTLYKFRSMVDKAEGKTGAMWSHDRQKCTRLGSFMRKTYLDELPQLVNVLNGDLSVVGPRPERPVFVRDFETKVPKYLERLNIKAGLTGWAAVNGYRGNTSLKERIRYDLYYIENWSLPFDIKIILKTIPMIIFRK